MRMRSSILYVVAALLASGSLTIADLASAGGKKEKAEMAAAAKVTIDQAAKVATEKTGGKVIEAELEKKHGKIIWEVKTVDADGKIVETHIDADSGMAIESKGKK